MKTIKIFQKFLFNPPNNSSSCVSWSSDLSNKTWQIMNTVVLSHTICFLCWQNQIYHATGPGKMFRNKASSMFLLCVLPQIIVCWHNETNCVKLRPPHMLPPRNALRHASFELDLNMARYNVQNAPARGKPQIALVILVGNILSSKWDSFVMWSKKKVFFFNLFPCDRQKRGQVAA